MNIATTLVVLTTLLALSDCGSAPQAPALRTQMEDRSCFGGDRLRGGQTSGMVVVDNLLMGSDLLSPLGEGRICGPFRAARLGTVPVEQHEGYDAQGRVMLIRACGGRSLPPYRREAVRDPQGRLIEIRDYECPASGRMTQRLAVEWSSTQSAALYAYKDNGQIVRDRGPTRTVSYAEGRATSVVPGTHSSQGWTTHLTIKDGRVVSSSSDLGGELSVENASLERFIVTMRTTRYGPSLTEAYSVIERDRFGNAIRVTPAELRREFGIESITTFPARFNFYSAEWPPS
jgi:hypothetical protein